MNWKNGDTKNSEADSLNQAKQLADGLNAALTQLTDNNEALDTAAENLITNGTGEGESLTNALPR